MPAFTHGVNTMSGLNLGTAQAGTDADNRWVRVVFAHDCEPCTACAEPVCKQCETHYADCECPGPHQDDEFEYREAGAGVLEARRLDD